MGGLDQRQGNIDTPLAVHVLEAKSSIEDLQCCCRDFVENALKEPVGAGKFCGHINRREFLFALDFAQARFDKAEDPEIKTFWLSMFDGAKAGIFLDLIEKGRIQRARFYALAQIHTYQNSEQFGKQFPVPNLGEKLLRLIDLWSDRLFKLEQGQGLAMSHGN